MRSRFLVGALAPMVLLAMSIPAFADQLTGVVAEIDRAAETLAIESEDGTAEPRIFTGPDGVPFEEFIGDIEVGDEVRIEFDRDLCGDNPNCANVAVTIESL